MVLIISYIALYWKIFFKYFIEAKCLSYSYLIIHYRKVPVRYEIKGFKGPEFQNFDHISEKKMNKYFEKQYTDDY